MADRELTSPEVIEQIRASLPIAKPLANGLLSKTNIIEYVDIIGKVDIDKIASYWGYATYDGAPMHGPLFSLTCSDSCIQLWSSYQGDAMLFRTYNQVSKEWNRWKQISFT